MHIPCLKQGLFRFNFVSYGFNVKVTQVTESTK